jgi:para-nitrobenzyl esterase
VPLLVGSNTQEGAWQQVLGGAAPTLANYRTALETMPGGALFRLYPAADDAGVEDAAMALASDRFLAASTWGWMDAHRRTGQPTWYYRYARVRPASLPPLPPTREPARGAVHSAEIEYALGNLDVNPIWAWTADDHAVSATLQGYFAAFVKTGDPNAPGLPHWTPAPAGDGPFLRQRIDVTTRAEPFGEAPGYPGRVAALDTVR